MTTMQPTKLTLTTMRESRNRWWDVGYLDMNNFRLTGLPPSLRKIGSDAVSWSQAVRLVRDSEINCVKKTGDIMNGNLVLSTDGNNDAILDFWTPWMILAAINIHMKWNQRASYLFGPADYSRRHRSSGHTNIQETDSNRPVFEL